MSRSRTIAVLVGLIAWMAAASQASAQFFDPYSAPPKSIYGYSNPAPYPYGYGYGYEPQRKRPVEPKAKAQPAAVIPEKPPQGVVQIVVSIPDQRLKVYAGGELYATAPVSSGMAGHSTPKGVFSILQKRKFHRSNI